MSETTTCPECGAEHHEPAIEVVIGSGARQALAAFVAARRWRTLLVVADANTDEVLAADLAAELAASGVEVERSIFLERHGLLADERAVDQVAAALAHCGAEAALAVGSGTLNDVTRYATFGAGLPYLVAPTAASMDGYASSVAAMQFGGVKVTYPAHGPLGIFADLDVVAAAPKEMAVWGLGDLAGKVSAAFDWRLGHVLTGEPYCARLEARVLGPLAAIVDEIESLLSGGRAPTEQLLRGLIESGIVMAVHGDSRPASGCEHHVSHLLDLLAYRDMHPHHPHGLQVGYATRFTTRLQRHLLERADLPLLSAPGGPEEGEARWLGRSEELEKVRAAKRAAFAEYRGSWPLAELAAVSAATTAFSPVDTALDMAGIPAAPGFVDVDAELLEVALRYANRMRERVTALDLLESEGELAEAIQGLAGG